MCACLGGGGDHLAHVVWRWAGGLCRYNTLGATLQGRGLSPADRMLRVRAKTARPLPAGSVGAPSRVNVYDHIEFAVFPGAVHTLIIQLTSSTSRAMTRYLFGQKTRRSRFVGSERLLLARAKRSLLRRARGVSGGRPTSQDRVAVHLGATAGAVTSGGSGGGGGGGTGGITLAPNGGGRVHGCSHDFQVTKRRALRARACDANCGRPIKSGLGQTVYKCKLCGAKAHPECVGRMMHPATPPPTPLTQTQLALGVAPPTLEGVGVGAGAGVPGSGSAGGVPDTLPAGASDSSAAAVVVSGTTLAPAPGPAPVSPSLLGSSPHTATAVDAGSTASPSAVAAFGATTSPPRAVHAHRRTASANSLLSVESGDGSDTGFFSEAAVAAAESASAVADAVAGAAERAAAALGLDIGSGLGVGGAEEYSGTSSSESDSDSESDGDGSTGKAVAALTMGGVKKKKKLNRKQRKAARRAASLQGLMFFRYVRVGEVTLSLSTRGFKWNLAAARVSLPANTFHHRLWTWRTLFRRIRKKAVWKVTKSAPMLVKHSLRKGRRMAQEMRPARPLSVFSHSYYLMLDPEMRMEFEYVLWWLFLRCCGCSCLHELC